MGEIFLKLLNLGIGAGWMVLAVLVVRVLFRKAPRWIFCVLWGLVAIRLVCPISLESTWSMVPSAATVVVKTHGVTDTPIKEEGESSVAVADSVTEDASAVKDNSATVGNNAQNDMAESKLVTINTGFSLFDEPVNRYLEERYQKTAAAPVSDTTSKRSMTDILGYVWLTGVIILLTYSFGSYLLLRRRVATATLYRKNIKQSEQVASPFVLGLFRPVIYLPYRIAEADIEPVLAHEQAHIQRKDHWWKPVGFAILSVYWFQPLLWLAYVLLCRDIEAACDERVIRKLGMEERRAYSVALLNCSVKRRRIAACPLAFGETGVKERIKKIMSYKKPSFWILILTAVAGLAVAICFMTNPKGNQGAEHGSNDFETPSEGLTPPPGTVDTGKQQEALTTSGAVDTEKTPVITEAPLVIYKPVVNLESENEIQKYFEQYQSMGIQKSDLTILDDSGKCIATGEDIVSISKDGAIIEFTQELYSSLEEKNKLFSISRFMLKDECIIEANYKQKPVYYGEGDSKSNKFMFPSDAEAYDGTKQYKNKLVYQKKAGGDDAPEWKLHAFARAVGIEAEGEILKADRRTEYCISDQKYQVDLNGDGTDEIIHYGMKGLVINGYWYPELYQKLIGTYEEYDRRYFYLRDFDTNDSYREILLYCRGDSSDEYSYVLRYTDEGELIVCGSLEGHPVRSDWIFDGKGHVRKWTRLRILQTWWGRMTYEIDSNHRLLLVAQEEYKVRESTTREYELKKPIRLYEARDTASAWTVLQPQTIQFLSTDNECFVCLKAEDGSTGYMAVEHFYKIIVADGTGEYANDVIDGLNNAD